MLQIKQSSFVHHMELGFPQMRWCYVEYTMYILLLLLLRWGMLLPIDPMLLLNTSQLDLLIFCAEMLLLSLLIPVQHNQIAILYIEARQPLLRPLGIENIFINNICSSLGLLFTSSALKSMMFGTCIQSFLRYGGTLQALLRTF